MRFHNYIGPSNAYVNKKKLKWNAIFFIKVGRAQKKRGDYFVMWANRSAERYRQVISFDVKLSSLSRFLRVQPKGTTLKLDWLEKVAEAGLREFQPITVQKEISRPCNWVNDSQLYRTSSLLWGVYKGRWTKKMSTFSEQAAPKSPRVNSSNDEYSVWRMTISVCLQDIWL